jgi:hypothetical protein
MAHHVNDALDRRLRAARPRTAHADEHAFDAELLARVRDQPIAARRTVPRAVMVPVAAGVTLSVTAVVMLAGGPGDVGGPSSASAITQALQWLNPPKGTILHARSVETSGTLTTTHEFWQSADDPALQRLVASGARASETAGDGFYDAATNTIHDAPDGKPGVPDMCDIPAGDPIVAKVRMLLRDGRMSVTGREVHNGVEAWAISLKPGAGRPAWTLWVSAADGKPLELRDPGRDASEEPQVIRWSVYEVLSDGDADRLLTVRGAHPTARVVPDPAHMAAEKKRLMHGKG